MTYANSMADRSSPYQIHSNYPLKRLCDAGVSLIDCDHRTPKPALSGYPYIAIPQIQQGRLDLSAVRLISKDDYKSWTQKYKPCPGDIIVTRRARVGDSAVIPVGLECAIGQNLVILRSDGTQVDQAFLRWALRGPFYEQQMSKFLNVGAVFDSLNCGDIPQFELPIPPLPTQHAIARILGSLDNKIELNRQMNETLEAMARAIFQSWFVDFDPVRAKAEGRDTGLQPEVAALFPSEIVEVDGREVPKGWGVERLPEVFEINPKRCLAKDDVAPYLDMQNVPTRGHRPIDWIMRAFGSGTKFVNGDTLLARITPCLENGKTIFVDFLDDGQVGWGSTEYIVLRPKSPLPTEFGYLLARDEDFRAHAILNMSGSSGRQRVPSECFDSYQIVVPSNDIARQFGELVNPLMAKIKANDEQSRTLAQIRDALLPKLMNGEIKVT